VYRGPVTNRSFAPWLKFWRLAEAIGLSPDRLLTSTQPTLQLTKRAHQGIRHCITDELRESDTSLLTVVDVACGFYLQVYKAD
jgi:pyrroloquinoline quinone (PQQ) biosynthesis protein C